MKKYNFFPMVLMSINPILGFLSSLYNIVRLKDSAIYFAISVAIIAIYFPIMYDTSANFFKVNHTNFTVFLEPYIAIPYFLKQKLGIDFYYFIFFNIIFVIYTWTKIVLKAFKSTNLRYQSILILIVLLFTFNYRDLMDINRTIFSYSFFFYYIFLIEKKNIVKNIFFFLMAAWFHFSSLILIVFYIVSFVRLDYRINLIILITSTFIGIYLTDFVSAFEALITRVPIVGSTLNFYFYSDTYGVQSFTLGTFLKKFTNCFFVFFSCLYAILIIKNNQKDRILQFIIFLGCLELIFMGFVTFFERINLAFNFLFIYLFFKGFNERYNIFLTGIIFFRSVCVYFLIYIPIFIGNYNDVMISIDKKNEMLVKPIYYFTPFLIDIHNNGYSDSFIKNNSIWKD
ncbi:EpsG family protein [Acinetobacter ursingii]|uniref:EpsG family protein n=1 Tax=Acinetobacter ursingii TaxID=108980 RepID=UPI0021CDAE80|nr:EpsG family protein [Acinetobacter ursingii]MCU4482544.1 EpsG family protein [Acinetobacter ursingii]MCU4506816.1 EpsG family protein [Acinetobacter ursingii]